jgi:hypothetical protein
MTSATGGALVKAWGRDPAMVDPAAGGGVSVLPGETSVSVLTACDWS